VAKAHARLRIGDVLTMALRGEVRVWRVMALAARRGPAPEARLLYEEVPELGAGAGPASDPCANSGPAAYEGAEAWPRGGDASDDDQHGSHEKAVEPAGDLPQDRHQER
jgi:hypothetical protein